ncbi:MAG: murein hydrolase activator EnvC family protein [Parabacteroides sp.]
MRSIGLVFFWIVFSVAAFGQQSNAVKQLEKQRKATLEAIESTNKLLKETKATAKNSLKRLNLLSQQIESRKKVISLLSEEMGEIDKEIAALRRQIVDLEWELKEKQTNYGKSVQSLYKRHMSQDKLLFILSAHSFSQSLRRIRYLREYADWQKKQAQAIHQKQDEIQAKRKELEQTRASKAKLLGTREAESKQLALEEENQKKEVSQLNKKQKELQAELKKKQAQANALNKQIERLIAEEIARAEAEAKAAREKANRNKGTSGNNKSDQVAPVETAPKREERVADTKGGYAMTREEKKLSDTFSGNRGRLPYPVAGRHVIVGRFGQQQHQELKHVQTNSNGIDIQTSPGSDARAVFNGVVTRVFVLPGYNNSVIIRHGNYLTVYSNLSQVYVKAGDKVTTRQAIGKIFTDTEEGNSTVLHFQIWKERTKLNPEPWLSGL